MLTVAEIKAAIAAASGAKLEGLLDRFADDGRIGVQSALSAARKRLARERAEATRIEGLYDFERDLAQRNGGGVVVGIDEVGRGPLAGPLAAGAVVLDPEAAPIKGLNDSKKVKPDQRRRIAQAIQDSCLAWAVSYVSPQKIDEVGMALSLRSAFVDVLQQIASQGVSVDIVLLDGNPVGFDEREVNVIKGDSLCASIAAASIVAKVARDDLMERLDEEYPGYGFAAHKGYGSKSHIGAIREKGLSTMHRKSFCTKILQCGNDERL